MYEKTGQLTAKMQRDAGASGAAAAARRACPIRCRAAVRQRQGLIDRRAGARRKCTFPPPTRRSIELNAFRSPAHRRLIFEEFFLFQLGIVLRRRRADAERKPRPVVVTDDIREAVAAGPAVQADGRSEDRDSRDRHRHAAAAADEPAAAGRRRRGQDHRRADGGAGRDGERPAGRVHGADRDSGGAALLQHPPAARAIALPDRAADRRHAGAEAARDCWRSSPAARCRW